MPAIRFLLFLYFLSVTTFFAAYLIKETSRAPGKVSISEVESAKKNLQLLENITWSGIEKLSSTSLSNYSAVFSHFNQLTIYTHSGIYFNLYRDKELIAWTSNKTAFSKEEIINIDNESFQRLPNAIYKILLKEINNYTITGFIEIYSDYPIQNKFLENKFNPRLGLNNYYSFSFISENGDLILDKHKEPVHSGILFNLFLIISIVSLLLAVYFTGEKIIAKGSGMTIWLFPGYLISFSSVINTIQRALTYL